MKKRRGIFWRWLPALLLGAGTWWLFRWAITPRVHFEATYNSQEYTKPAKAVLRALGIEIQSEYIQWDTNNWDREGRYLLVGARWEGLAPNCYDLIDLQTRKTLIKQQLTSTQLDFRDRGHEIRTAHSNGDNFGFKSRSSSAPDEETRGRLAKEILNGSITFRVNRERREQNEPEIFYRPQLWSWNALSNQEKLIRQFSMFSDLKICHDGTALLEIERVTPMLPNFLIPLSLPNVLTAQVTAEMGLEDLAVMRVWNLPEMTLRSTVNVPWMYRQGQAEITADGSYVVLRDVNLPREFISKHHYQYEFTHHQYRSIQDAYACSPTGMRVYETRTGNLWWEKSDSPGVYSEFDQPGNDFAQFSMNRESLLKVPCLLLHLPTRQLIETNYCVSAEQLSTRQFQFVSQHDGEKPCYEIHLNDGIENGRRLEGDMQPPRFISGVPQVVVQRLALNSDYFPTWLQTPIRSMKWFSDLLEGLRYRVEVIDYSANRTLISNPVDIEHQHVAIQVTNRWLVIQQSYDDGLKVTVYSLPFSSWSPLWPWATGLLVSLLTLYLLRQRQPQRP